MINFVSWVLFLSFSYILIKWICWPIMDWLEAVEEASRNKIGRWHDVLDLLNTLVFGFIGIFWGILCLTGIPAKILLSSLNLYP